MPRADRNGAKTHRSPDRAYLEAEEEWIRHRNTSDVVQKMWDCCAASIFRRGYAIIDSNYGGKFGDSKYPVPVHIRAWTANELDPIPGRLCVTWTCCPSRSDPWCEKSTFDNALTDENVFKLADWMRELAVRSSQCLQRDKAHVATSLAGEGTVKKCSKYIKHGWVEYTEKISEQEGKRIV